MASSLLTALVTSLGSALPTGIAGAFNGHAQATTDIQGLLSEAAAVIDDPAKVTMIAMQIGGVSNAPLQTRIDSMNLAKFATNPAMAMQIIAKMEAYLNTQSGNFLTHLLGMSTTATTTG
jgi:hypothetical protein